MQFRSFAIAAVLVLGAGGAALGQTLTFDLLNNTDETVTSMRFVGGKILDFTPMAPGETRVFHVESTSGACDLLVRARFSRGQQVSSGAYLCDPRGKAFVDRGSSIKIVFRDQLGF